jgi:hypothetical protein
MALFLRSRNRTFMVTANRYERRFRRLSKVSDCNSKPTISPSSTESAASRERDHAELTVGGEGVDHGAADAATDAGLAALVPEDGHGHALDVVRQIALQRVAAAAEAEHGQQYEYSDLGVRGDDRYDLRESGIVASGKSLLLPDATVIPKQRASSSKAAVEV